MRSKRWWLILGLFLVAVFAIGVTPLRQIAIQNEQVNAARDELATLEEENAALAERAAVLETNAGIERLAREQFGLVRPGDRLYTVDTSTLQIQETVDTMPEAPPAEPNVFTDVLDFLTGQDVVDAR